MWVLLPLVFDLCQTGVGSKQWLPCEDEPPVLPAVAGSQGFLSQLTQYGVSALDGRHVSMPYSALQLRAENASLSISLQVAQQRQLELSMKEARNQTVRQAPDLSGCQHGYSEGGGAEALQAATAPADAMPPLGSDNTTSREDHEV